MSRPGRIGSMILLWVVLALALPAQAAERGCPSPVLALTYNIRLDTPADGPNAWPHRRDFLLGQLMILRPGLLGMQEVLPNQRAELESGLASYAFVGGGRDDGERAGEASPIAIDRFIFRVKASGTFWLSPTPGTPSKGWDAAFPRIASWARVERLQDRARLLVVNTHWDHVGIRAREASGALLRDWIAAHRKPGEQVLLMGDFNTTANSAAMAALIDANSGLRDTRTTARHGTSGPDFSFNSFDPMPASGQMIDHILVSAGIGVIKHMVIAQHAGGRVASDHFPVGALFDLPSPHGKPRCGAQQTGGR